MLGSALALRSLAVALFCAVTLGGCLGSSDPAFDEVPPDVAAFSLEIDGAPIAGCPDADLAPYMPRFDGLLGSYSRSGSIAPEGEVSSFSIRSYVTRPDSIAITGRWDGFVKTGGLMRFQYGSYQALPDNPAIGNALALTTATGASAWYVVLGHHRNALGRIDRMCLIYSGTGTSSPFPGGAPRTPFMVRRVGF